MYGASRISATAMEEVGIKTALQRITNENVFL